MYFHASETWTFGNFWMDGVLFPVNDIRKWVSVLLVWFKNRPPEFVWAHLEGWMPFWRSCPNSKQCIAEGKHSWIEFFNVGKDCENVQVAPNSGSVRPTDFRGSSVGSLICNLSASLECLRCSWDWCSTKGFSGFNCGVSLNVFGVVQLHSRSFIM